MIRTTSTLVSILFLLLISSSPAAFAALGPKLSVSESKLAAAVWCDPSVSPDSGKQAVLLIHGTGATPDEAWGWGYQKALPKDGFGVCTVTLPERAVGDVTVSIEYAVYAARYAFQRSGRKIAIIGHSQGGFIAAWIVKFWPDIAEKTTDVISLAGPMQGTRMASTICKIGSCTPVTWQLAIGSEHTAALVNKPIPKGPAFTSISSQFDGIVFPQPLASALPGAANIMVQKICSLRAVEHGLMLIDAVGYALVLDALRHEDGASATRIPEEICEHRLLPEADIKAAIKFIPTITSLAVGLTDVSLFVSEEPALPDYAAPYGNPDYHTP